MAVYLVPSGDTLRDEIRTRWLPNTTIMWVGDRAHATRTSDHNPERWAGEGVWDGAVHAIDVPNFPRLDALCEYLRARADTGKEPRLTYIIRNRRMCSAKTDWRWVPYYGSNPHTAHAHFSFSYVTAYEIDRRPWTAGFDVAAPTPAPTAGTAGNTFGAWYTGAPGTRRNKLWDSGTDVQVLQKFIGVDGDGFFGRGTETALKQYQVMRGYTPDGIAGPQTWGPILDALR